MTETSIVGKSLEHEVMEKEGTHNLLKLSEFVINLQNQTNNHEKRIAGLEDNMRISGVQEMTIKDKGNSAVLKALDGKESNAYQNSKIRGRVFSAMWRRFKKHYGIPRYGELAAKDFDSAVSFLERWEPDKELKMEIELANNQVRMDV